MTCADLIRVHRDPPFCSPVGLWALPLGPRQIGTLWRWVAGALGRVLACLAHRHARPAGGGADVGDRREQGALPEVVGLPPGGLIKQVRFGPAMEGAPLLRPALRTRASRLVDRGGGDAAAAEHQYAALLPVDGRVLGPEHPATLGGRNDLARWTEEAGDPAAAGTTTPSCCHCASGSSGRSTRPPWPTRHELARWTGRADGAPSTA